MKNRTALITGVTGQDGAYLSKLLLEKGYTVFGGYTESMALDLRGLTALGIEKDLHLVPCELLDFASLLGCIRKIRPDEVYNLAAQSSVALSFQEPVATAEINAVGVVRLLEAIRAVSQETRFFQASSCEILGQNGMPALDEDAPFAPRNPYAIAKLYAHFTTKSYRASLSMPACCGILFNHESPLRGVHFVTRKITMGLAAIRRGEQERLELGNLDAQRDWGFAGDYVEGMWLMLQQPPRHFDDYVFATGELHSIRDFIDTAARCNGFDIAWKGCKIEECGYDRKTGKTIVRVDPTLLRPSEIKMLPGNASKARTKLGWTPKVSFEELVAMMANADR